MSLVTEHQPSVNNAIVHAPDHSGGGAPSSAPENLNQVLAKQVRGLTAESADHKKLVSLLMSEMELTQADAAELIGELPDYLENPNIVGANDIDLLAQIINILGRVFSPQPEEVRETVLAKLRARTQPANSSQETVEKDAPESPVEAEKESRLLLAALEKVAENPNDLAKWVAKNIDSDQMVILQDEYFTEVPVALSKIAEAIKNGYVARIVGLFPGSIRPDSIPIGLSSLPVEIRGRIDEVLGDVQANVDKIVKNLDDHRYTALSQFKGAVVDTLEEYLRALGLEQSGDRTIPITNPVDRIFNTAAGIEDVCDRVGEITSFNELTESLNAITEDRNMRQQVRAISLSDFQNFEEERAANGRGLNKIKREGRVRKAMGAFGRLFGGR